MLSSEACVRRSSRRAARTSGRRSTDTPTRSCEEKPHGGQPSNTVPLRRSRRTPFLYRVQAGVRVRPQLCDSTTALRFWFARLSTPVMTGHVCRQRSRHLHPHPRTGVAVCASGSYTDCHAARNKHRPLLCLSRASSTRPREMLNMPKRVRLLLSAISALNSHVDFRPRR